MVEWNYYRNAMINSIHTTPDYIDRSHIFSNLCLFPSFFDELELVNLQHWLVDTPLTTDELFDIARATYHVTIPAAYRIKNNVLQVQLYSVGVRHDLEDIIAYFLNNTTTYNINYVSYTSLWDLESLFTAFQLHFSIYTDITYIGWIKLIQYFPANYVQYDSIRDMKILNMFLRRCAFIKLFEKYPGRIYPLRK